MTVADPVTAIANDAFANHKAIEVLVLPAGLKTVGNSAFASCNSLAYNTYVFVDIALVIVAGIFVLSSASFLKTITKLQKN